MKIISNFRAKLDKAITLRILSAWSPMDTSLAGAASRGAFSEGPPALLKAASSLYEKGLRKDQARRLRKRVKLAAPVISIGNLSVGGTGKSPLTIWMCELLLKIGLHPAVLTRGYARGGSSPGLVPSLGNTAELSALFGDEPVMISERLPSVPVWVGKNRAASGKAALAGGGVDVLVLDDGFQHLALERDLDIVLLDRRSPFRKRICPACRPAPRTPFKSQKGRCSCDYPRRQRLRCGASKRQAPGTFSRNTRFCLPAHDERNQPDKRRASFPINSLLDRKTVAFAGIVRPESFFKELGEAGITICDSLSFPDHHRYETGDLLGIFDSASKHGAEIIITTAKDAVRIPPPCRDAIAVAEMGIDFGAGS